MTAIGISALVAYLLLLAAKVLLARRYVRRCPSPSSRARFDDVTILQAVLGGDPMLEDALAANVQALTGARFVWLLDADDTAGWAVCRRVAAAFPDALIELQSTPPVTPGLNPKLFKLDLAERHVATSVMVVLDDDTRLTRAGLAAMIDGLATDDVVTGLPCYAAGSTVAAQLVAQFVNNQSILTYLPLLNFHPPITLNGMAYAFRSERLRAIGGFHGLRERLTDDLAVARMVLAAGGRIRQTPVPHTVMTTVNGLPQYQQLLHRWFLFALLLVRAQPVRWRATILALHGLPPVLLWLGVVCAVVVPDWSIATVLGVVLVTRGVLIVTAQSVVGGGFRHHPAWSLVSELLQPLHLLHAIASRQIRWRTRVIEVRADDDFSCR